MPTRLEELVASIDPSRLFDRVSDAVDSAFNSFGYDNRIRSFEDYQKYMSEFVQHIEQTILRFKSNDPYDREFFWTRYSNLVNSAQGRDAWKLNYEKILTGKDGGLYQLLKDVAALVLQDRSKQQISNLVWAFWNNLSNDEKLETVDEFLNKFGHILPSEYTGGGGAYLKANFPRFLEKYPQLLMEIRRSVR